VQTIHSRIQQLVAGALYNFCAHLTALKKPLTVGAQHDAPPLVEELKEWASQRGVWLGDPEHDWVDEVNPVRMARKILQREFIHSDGLIETYQANITMLLVDHGVEPEMSERLTNKVIGIFTD
jgi:hypothetical protein